MELNWLYISSSVLILCLILYFSLRLILKKYYRRVYRKRGIEGLSQKYNWFSRIFTKPEDILGMSKKEDIHKEAGKGKVKNFNYLHQYGAEISENELMQDDGHIVGMQEPIGPNTEKIFRERFGKFNFNFGLKKLGVRTGGYWVNYVMMQKQSSKGIENNNRSL